MPNTLETRHRRIVELRLNARNPRVHTPRQIRQIARSIETFGFVNPVLIDVEDQILAGHGRVLGAQLLGLSQVPTIQLEHLTAAQATAFMIADNRLTENSTWDDRLLAEHFKALSLVDLEFDLDVTGFEIGEIDFRIESLNGATELRDDPADHLPDSRGLPAVTRPGDLWQLDQHRVLCADALAPVSYRQLMDEHLAAAVISDCPYNVRIDGNVSGLGSIRHREFVMASGEMTEAEYASFLSGFCSLFARHSVNGSLHYVFIDWRHVSALIAAGRQTYSELKNLCVWAKDTPGMGSLYRSQHELICVFKKGRERHRNNVQLGQYGRNRSNLWSYPAVNSFARRTEEGNLLALHPTVKPVALIADAIMDCTARNDSVLDGFLGSGTTLIAAQRTGRRCYGIELDPLYVDTAIRRWQAFTRGSARHAASGRTFDQIQSEREGENG